MLKSDVPGLVSTGSVLVTAIVKNIITQAPSAFISTACNGLLDEIEIVEPEEFRGKVGAM